MLIILNEIVNPQTVVINYQNSNKGLDAFIKARPNYVGFLKILDAWELRTRNASEQGIDSLGVSLVLGYQALIPIVRILITRCHSLEGGWIGVSSKFGA